MTGGGERTKYSRSPRRTRETTPTSRRGSPSRRTSRGSPRRAFPDVSPRRGRRASPRRSALRRTAPRRSSPCRSPPRRSSPRRSSPRRSSPRRSSPRRSSPRRSSPRRSSPRRSPPRKSQTKDSRKSSTERPRTIYSARREGGDVKSADEDTRGADRDEKAAGRDGSVNISKPSSKWDQKPDVRQEEEVKRKLDVTHMSGVAGQGGTDQKAGGGGGYGGITRSGAEYGLDKGTEGSIAASTDSTPTIGSLTSTSFLQTPPPGHGFGLIPMPPPGFTAPPPSHPLYRAPVSNYSSNQVLENKLKEAEKKLEARDKELKEVKRQLKDWMRKGELKDGTLNQVTNLIAKVGVLKKENADLKKENAYIQSTVKRMGLKLPVMNASRIEDAPMTEDASEDAPMSAEKEVEKNVEKDVEGSGKEEGKTKRKRRKNKEKTEDSMSGKEVKFTVEEKSKKNNNLAACGNKNSEDSGSSARTKNDVLVQSASIMIDQEEEEDMKLYPEFTLEDEVWAEMHSEFTEFMHNPREKDDVADDKARALSVDSFKTEENKDFRVKELNGFVYVAKNLTQRCKNKYDKACKLCFKRLRVGVDVGAVTLIYGAGDPEVGGTFFVCIKHVYRSYGPEIIKKVKQIRMAENRAAAISRKRMSLLAKKEDAEKNTADKDEGAEKSSINKSTEVASSDKGAEKASINKDSDKGAEKASINKDKDKEDSCANKSKSAANKDDEGKCLKEENTKGTVEENSSSGDDEGSDSSGTDTGPGEEEEGDGKEEEEKEYGSDDSSIIPATQCATKRVRSITKHTVSESGSEGGKDMFGEDEDEDEVRSASKRSRSRSNRS